MKTNPLAVVDVRSLTLALFVSLAGLPAGAAVFDDFESYTVGSNLHGQGGWSGWAGIPGAGAVVSTSFSFSPTRAVNVTGAADLVHAFSGVTNGQWVCKVMQYIPATSSGTNYVILLNRYQPPFTVTELNWSVQIQNNLDTGQIISDLGAGASRPMVKNQWVEIRVEVNLASNTVTEFYNGQLLSTHVWQDGSGLNEIQALDLFANLAGPVYYDNVSLAPAPPPAPALRISNTGPDTEGLPTFLLEWDAISNATYGVQVSTDLASGSWETIDLVTPTSNLGNYKIPADQRLLLNLHLYSRLVLPRPLITAVEPAIFPPGVPVDAYVIGQCFESSDVVRVDGVPVSSMVYLNPNQFHGPLPTLSVGRHLVELVRGGVVVSSFTVTCADPVVNPELVLQGPPTEPPASPHARLTKSRSNIQNNRLGGWRDVDDDGDSVPTINEDLARQLPAPRSETRLDAWASVVEMTTGGGGVSPFSGEVQLGVADLVIPGRGLDFAWVRTYRSRTGPSTAHGHGWDFSYNVSLAMQSDGSVLLRPGNGRADAFYPSSNGGWSRPEYFVEIGDLDVDGFPDVVTFADSGKWVFNSLLGGSAPGKLAQIVDRNGNTMALHYDGGGQLIEVVDDLDRTNTVAYNLAGQIASVTDFSGRIMRYEYDGNGDLVTVISPAVIGTPNGNDFPGGKTNTFTYSSGYLDDRENHLLLTVKDATPTITHKHVYQHNQTDLEFLRCISVQRGTNPPTMFSYLPQTPTPSSQFATLRCIVNDSVGNVTEYFSDARNRCVKLQEFTGRATSGVPVTATVNRPTGKLRSSDPDYYETKWTWNNDSLRISTKEPTKLEYPNLRFVYQSDFDATTPARKRADLRVLREIASSAVDVDGDGVADLTERAWRYTYDSRFGSSGDRYLLGLRSYDPNKQYVVGDSVIYNKVIYQAGLIQNMRSRLDALESKLQAFGLLARGPRQSTSLDGSHLGSAYHDNPEIFICPSSIDDFVTSATDPRGNVTTGNYDTSGNCSKVTKRTYVASHYALELDGEMSYSAHGQLTAITNAPDATGYRRADTFEYYTNGPMAGYLYAWKIDASTPDTTITTGPCEYDLRGNVTRIVGPRAHDTLYTYNALNQLVRYQTPTNLTARCTTDFTYDANNNLVESATELRDANDAFVRTIVPKHVFDVLGRCVATMAQVSSGQFVTNKFFYDANDNLVAVHSPLAVSGADPHAITQIAYDERGLPFQTIAAPGSTIRSTTQYDYDANGNMTRVSEGLESTPRVTTLEYDGFASGGGRGFYSLPEVGDELGYTSFEHGNIKLPVVVGSVWGSPSSLQRYRGNGTMYDVDVAVTSSSLEFSVGARYAAAGETCAWSDGMVIRPAKITDPNGNVTTFNYDANDNLKVARHFGQLNDVPGTNGNVRLAERRWKYDGLDRCVEASTAFFNPATQAPIGDGVSVTTFAYAPNGQCTNVTDDLGRATRFGYDTAGRHISTTSAGAKTVTAVFRDAAGNVTRSTQTDVSDLGGPPQVFSRTNVYDSLNRLVSTTDNVGNTNRYAYNSLSVVVHAIDRHGNWNFIEEDDLGRRTLAVADLNGDGLQDLVVDVNTSWAYDANSRLVSSTDDNTNTTFYAYDSLNRQILVTSPDGTHSSLVWSPRSNLILQQDPNGTVISNTFDLIDRCVRRDITPGPGVATTTTFETFAYNGRSRLVAATNDASHSEFEYNSLGDCTGNHNDGWNILRAEYDGVGNRVSLTYPSGRIVTYAYDALNQVTNVSSSASAMTPPTSLAQFAYAGPGRETRVTRANGTQTDIAWNGMVSPPNAPGDFGRWQRSGIGHTMVLSGVSIDQRVFTYDRNQNKTLRAQIAPFHVGGPMTTNLFAYDALNRMTDFARSSGSTDDYVQTYVLDGNGNRQTVFSNGVPQSYVMEATIPPADFQMDQYTITPFDSRSYDENGNRIAKNSTVAQLQYQYDFANRLVAVYDLTTGSIVPVASYSYDALGQRISKTVYPPAPALPVTTVYVQDFQVGEVCDDGNNDSGDGCRILETRIGGVLSDVFVHVTGLKEEIRENDSVFRSAPPLVRFSPAGMATYLHADDLGNVLALTDDLGNVIGRNDYDDFGLPIFLTSDGFPIATNASPTGNPFLFHGMEWDAETGLYYQSANFAEANFDTGFNSPLYDGDCFSRSGGGQYFDPQTASVTRHKSHITSIDLQKATLSLSPWSDGRVVRKMIPVTVPDITGAQRRVSVNGSGANSARIPAGFVAKKNFGQLAGKK